MPKQLKRFQYLLAWSEERVRRLHLNMHFLSHSKERWFWASKHIYLMIFTTSLSIRTAVISGESPCSPYGLWASSKWSRYTDRKWISNVKHDEAEFQLRNAVMCAELTGLRITGYVWPSSHSAVRTHLIGGCWRNRGGASGRRRNGAVALPDHSSRDTEAYRWTIV